MLHAAYSIERKSEHPLAAAIVKYAEENGISYSETDNFTAIPGKGLSASIGVEEVRGGNYEFINSVTAVSDDLRARAERLAGEGKTPMYFSRGGRCLGMIAVADVIKDDSCGAVDQLHNMGLRVVMLTGDNKRTAEAIGAQAGVDEVIANVLPDVKEKTVRGLKNTGKVIIETFRTRGIDPVHVPGVLCASHGPFTWGKDAAQAVYHAVVLEEVAKMAILTLTIDPDAQPAPQHVLDKHFMRKHGPNAYYGQK